MGFFPLKVIEKKYLVKYFESYLEAKTQKL